MVYPDMIFETSTLTFVLMHPAIYYEQKFVIVIPSSKLIHFHLIFQGNFCI